MKIKINNMQSALIARRNELDLLADKIYKHLQEPDARHVGAFLSAHNSLFASRKYLSAAIEELASAQKQARV